MRSYAVSAGVRVLAPGCGVKRSPIKRTAFRAKRKGEPKALTEARKAVQERSGGRCEVMAAPGCDGIGVHLHHRILRRHGDHSPDALLFVCVHCHGLIHANPELSYWRGWLILSSGADPAVVPVLRGLG